MKKKTNVDQINDIWGRLTTATSPEFTSKYWSPAPVFIRAQEVGESVEFIYKQVGPIITEVFKIVYSCVDGKWNKSAPIYGEIIPPQGETYLFKDK